MNYRLFFRRFLLMGIIAFLLWFAWQELAGGLRQFPRSNTFGREVETFIQLGCGLLSLMTVLTCFWWQNGARSVRIAWAISLAAVAGLSSQVWGPPMPLVALVLAVAALLLSLMIIWGLRRLTAFEIHTMEQPDKK